MTPKQVYELPVKKLITNFEFDYCNYYLVGWRFNHIPEIDEILFKKIDWSKNKAVECKVHAEIYEDISRFWRLASVWYGGTPIMVIRNAGREGDDYQNRIITDVARYKEMINYIWQLPRFPMELMTLSITGKDIATIDQEIEGMDHFYGRHLKI